jgi:hypothetical protein
MLTLLSRQEDPHPMQIAYWDWMLQQSKPVTVQSYKSDPTLEKIITDRLGIVSPKVKECYSNAWMVAATGAREIEVVVGFFSSMGIPVEHAWNFYKPKKIHFDLTYEICLKKIVENETYMQIIKTDAGKAARTLRTNEFEIMGFMGLYFHKYIFKGKKK